MNASYGSPARSRTENDYLRLAQSARPSSERDNHLRGERTTLGLTPSAGKRSALESYATSKIAMSAMKSGGFNAAGLKKPSAGLELSSLMKAGLEFDSSEDGSTVVADLTVWSTASYAIYVGGDAGPTFLDLLVAHNRHVQTIHMDGAAPLSWK